MCNCKISSEILLRLFEYKDGDLIWRVNTGKKNKIGFIAGCEKGNGYISIGIFGRKYLAHRIVWIMHNGDIPPNMEVDHINHNRADNRIENLRLVTRLENNMNKSVQINNSSGVTGVTFCKQTGKWRAQIQINGKNVSLGRYESIHEAETARKTAQKDFSFHKNHGV